MALRPPTHRIDATGIYIHPAESAWDEERILSEQNEMKERGEKTTDHPAARYHGGWTRYDLDALFTFNDSTVTIRDYLDMSKHPALWRLRRLNVREHYDVQGMWDQDVSSGVRPYRAYLRACEVGLLSVEDGPELEGSGEFKNLTRADMDRLHNLSPEAPGLPVDIGMAVHNFSATLREDEKKA